MIASARCAVAALTTSPAVISFGPLNSSVSNSPSALVFTSSGIRQARTRRDLISSIQIFQVELFGLFVIAEEFSVAAPPDDRTQRIFRVIGGHVIFQFVAETNGGCAMVPSLIQYLPDAVRQRDIFQQFLAEQLLSAVDVSLSKGVTFVGQVNVALFENREVQQLQCFTKRQQIVDLVMKDAGKRRQIGPPLIGSGGKRLH